MAITGGKEDDSEQGSTFRWTNVQIGDRARHDCEVSQRPKRGAAIPNAGQCEDALAESVVKPDAARIKRIRMHAKPWRAHWSGMTEPDRVNHRRARPGVTLAVRIGRIRSCSPVAARLTEVSLQSTRSDSTHSGVDAMRMTPTSTKRHERARTRLHRAPVRAVPPSRQPLAMARSGRTDCDRRRGLGPDPTAEVSARSGRAMGEVEGAVRPGAGGVPRERD